MANSVQTAAMLLEKTSVINKQFEARYMETGEVYNVFKAAGIGEKEVYMCNVLADLLDPKGLHYRKSVYLERFMDMVVIPRIEKAGALDPKRAEVNKQNLTNEGRFIDIAISDGNVFIPIEVKIYASEQPKQLTDYAAFSRKMNKADSFIPVLFLTPDGHKSEKAKEDDYISISFEKDILPWLEACLALEERAPIRETIKQYIKAIKLFCGYLEDEEMAKEIKDLIMDSWDNYEAALLVKKTVDEINGKVREIFETQIHNLVKKVSPGMGAWPEENQIFYYNFKLGNGLTFSVSHDIKEFFVKKPMTEAPLSDERNNKIISKMTEITNDRNTAKEDFIWISKNARYHGLEKYDGDRYYYELYQIYSKAPQSVADWIVSIAKELEKI